MPTTAHTVTVTPAAPETPFGDGPYTLDCTCGEHVTYSGRCFTQVEAQRHLAYHGRKNEMAEVAR